MRHSLIKFLLISLSFLQFTSVDAAPLQLDEINSQIQQLKAKEEKYGERPTELDTWLEIKNLVQNRLKSKLATSKYQSEINAAPKALETITSTLNKQIPSTDIQALNSLSYEEVQSELESFKAQLNAQKEQKKTLTKTKSTRAFRRSLLVTEIASTQVEVNNLATNQTAIASASEQEKAAQQLENTQRTSFEAQLEELKTELKYYSTTDQLFAARIELNQRKIETLKEKTETLQNIFNQKTEELTAQSKKRSIEQTKRFADIPALAKISRENVNLADLRSDLAAKTKDVKAFSSTVTKQLEQVRANKQNALNRIKLLESAGIGIDTKTGELLRKQRAALPTSDTLKAKLKENLIASTSAQIELLETRNRFLERNPVLQKEINALYQQADSDTLDKPSVESLLKQNAELLDLVLDDYERYIAALGVANGNTRNIIQAVDKYGRVLDERLLWIPSAKKLQSSDLFAEQNALSSLFSSESISQWSQSFRLDFSEHIVLWLSFIITLISLVSLRPRARRLQKSMAEVAVHRHCTSILPTLKALIATSILSLPIALTLGFLSWRVYPPISISHGLSIAAFCIGLVAFIHRLAGSNGLLKNHFQFGEEQTKHIFFHASWYLFSAPPLFFLTASLPLTSYNAPHSGRMSFILAMLLTLCFAHLLFRPAKGLIHSNQSKIHSWIPKAVYTLVVATPLIFILGSSLGYITSVRTLCLQTASTVIVILATLLIAKICARWILVSRRHLAKSQARQKYKAIRAAEQNENNEDGPSLEEIEANAVNVVTVEEQTRRLVRIAAVIIIFFSTWNIWSSTLPALSALDKVTFFDSQETADSATSSSDPTSSITDTLTGQNITETSQDASNDLQNTEKSNSGISLKAILTSCFIIGFTLIAARNLPGLLELSVLSRLNLQPGGNYAITTIMRYLIIAGGALAAFGKIGISWSSVQWLAAAVTLGIGFGLQEIFANFVAGLIILFERPIRLGDVVTIGDISGRVSQIKIRATTIKQFNNRELLVPNKEFITGKLVNWSLADNVLRFDVNVGIAYGADTQLATKLLKEIAAKHEKVLETPKPEVIFSSFGASSLDFALRAHVGHYDDLVPTQSELHFAIDEAFRKDNLEISFPQRDIHIRSLPDNTAEMIEKAKTNH